MIRALVWLTLLLVAALLALLFLVTAPTPVAERPAGLTLADMDRARAILHRFGVRQLREGQLRQVRLSRDDLALGLNYLLTGVGQGSAWVTLGETHLTLRASWRMPYLARHFNLKLVLAESGDVLVPVTLRLGRLPLPAGAAANVALGVLARTAYGEQFAVARGMLRQARVAPDGLDLQFVWHGEAMARTFNPTGLDPVALGVYRETLGAVRGRDFTAYLGKAFALAQSRSGTCDPLAENRVALTALAEIALGGKLVSARGIARPPRRGGVRLAHREDAAQHFAVSAYLAANGGANLSDMAGLYKEMRDARGGSGFSFADLAADRAGSRLGAESVASVASARRMQRRLADLATFRPFFPDLRGLPEFMGEAEFRERFGGIGGPAYLRMEREIEARIDALALYRK